MEDVETKAGTRTITWDDPMEALTRGAGLSGLEFMQAIFEGMLPAPPITATMGFMGGTAEEGKVTFVGEAGEHLFNPIGVVPGAFARTVPAPAMACPVHTTTPAAAAPPPPAPHLRPAPPPPLQPPPLTPPATC